MTQKFGYLGPKVNFLFWNRDFCQQGISPVLRGLQLAHLDQPQKNSVSELWVFFCGSPWFLAVSGHSHFAIISSLNFGPLSTKLGGTVQAIKKMTHNDNGLGPGWKYGEIAAFTFGRKVFFLPKIRFPNKTPQICSKTDIYFGKWHFAWSWLEHGVP